MNTRKIIILASIGLALFMIVPATPANAQGCYYCNPLLFPIAVAAAVVGTAAAIATAPFCPYCGPSYYGAPPPPPVHYSAPPPPPPAYYSGPPAAPAYYGAPPYGYRVWIRGHYNKAGAWVPGHWRDRH
ncbi:MAG: hypothetical protein ABSG35_09770 [Syntrophobacteraceae bacterium]|jgi:hypothetical protein